MLIFRIVDFSVMDAQSHASHATEIDVLQHWAAEGADPLTELIDDFKRSRGDLTFENRSKHVSSLRLTVKSRILRENPPDLWAEWPGKNLRLAVDAGVVADVTDVVEGSDIEREFAETALEAARFDGRYRCLPTNVHRINNLFYDVELVDRAGVDVASLRSATEFVDAVAALDDALDVAPLVVNARDPFGPLQLWETLVIAEGGADCYEDLLAGHADRHRGVVADAVEMLDELLEHAPDDASFTSSSQADLKFTRGAGAMLYNGGWALGRMKQAEDFEYGTDWEYRPFPGTDDVFQLNMDAIVPAAHVEGDDAVGSFLRYLGSRDSIQHINDTLGSVPPREDVATDSLHPVTRQQYDALDATAAQLHSMTHGLGVTPEQLIDLKNATASFLQTRDCDALARRIVQTL